MNYRAQGTIEYLVIIGIVIVVSLSLVGITIGFIGNAQSTGELAQTIQNQTGLGAITLSETSLNEDGNYLLIIKGQDPGFVTITNVKINDINQNYSEQLSLGSTKAFQITTTENCTLRQNQISTITITYTTKYGIPKTETQTITTNCENYNIPTGTNLATSTNTKNLNTLLSITLSSPSNGNTDNDGTVDFNFTLTNASTTDNCYLIFNKTAISTTSNLSEGTNSFSNIDISTYTMDTNHNWDVNCDYSDTNYSSTTGEFNIIYPSIYLSSTQTGLFTQDENLLANFNPNYDDQNTYWYKWYKNNDLNATSLLTNGLVSYYPFTQNTKDYNSNNNGTTVGATIGDGKIGNGYYFGGDGDSITIEDNPTIDLTNGVTISTWIKDDYPHGTRGIISKGSYALKIGADNKPYFEVEDGNVTISAYATTSAFGPSDTIITSGAIYNGELYTSVRYNYSGDNNGRVYKYNIDSDTWTHIGQPSTLTGACNGLAVYDENLYTGCYGTGTVYRYDTSDDTNWVSIGINPGNASDNIAVVGNYKGKLMVYNMTDYKLHLWDGTSFETIETGSRYKKAYAVINGDLYTAESGSNVYKYSGFGTSWSSIGGGYIDRAESLSAYNGKIYSGGYNNGPHKVYNGGTSWTTLGSTGNYIFSQLNYNDDLYVVHSVYLNVADLYKVDKDNTRTKVFDFPETANFYIYNGLVYDGKIFYGTNKDGSLRIIGHGGAAYSSTKLTNTWTHLVGTYDGSNVKVYLNGELKGSRSTSITIANNDMNLLIGKSFGQTIGGSYGVSSGSEDFNGYLDEIGIYNRALTATEISQLYYGTLTDGNILSSNLLTTGDNWKVTYKTNLNDTEWTSDINSQIITITG